MTLLRRLPVMVLPILLLALLAAGASAAVNLVPWKSASTSLWSKPAAPVAPPIKVVPLDPDAAAEASPTYTATLARLIEANCGKMEIPWLDMASEAEKQADPAMAALAVAAAERRAGTLTRKSCSYIDGEIGAAEKRAEASQAPVAPAAH